MKKPVYVSNEICDIYIRVLWMNLVIWKPPYNYSRASWGFDADGAFAICTPWFIFYPW